MGKQESKAGEKKGTLDWSKPKVIQDVPIEQLKPDPKNPRTTASRGNMERLIADIKKNGVKTPLKVRRGASDSEGIVQGGHRRLYAATEAGLATVPCVLEARELSDAESLEELLLDNEHREDLPPMDKARAIKELMALRSWTQQQVADALNIEQGTVSTLLRLLHLPESIQAHVNDGSIPVSTGYAISRFEKSQQAEIATKVLAGKLTGTQVGQMVNKEKRGERGGKPNRNAVSGSDSDVAFKTDRTFQAPKGVAVTVRSLTSNMSKADIAEALEAVIGELSFKMR